MAKLLDEILRQREVQQASRLSRTTIWRGVKAGTFPKPVQLTRTTIGWFRADVIRWQAERRAAAGLPEQFIE
jgi:prophage regulatory protein